MLRALLPLLLTCGISAAAPPNPASVAAHNAPAGRPQAQPVTGSVTPASATPALGAAPSPATAPANTAAPSAANSPANSPANPPTPTPVKPAKTDPAQEGLRSDSYRALLSLIVMGSIALRHARTGSP